MNEHLPILQVLLPLMAAPICLLVRNRRIVRLLSIGVAWACLAIATTLLVEVLERGPISYALGGWAPPVGIEYRVDVANAYVLVIVSAIAAVVFPFGMGRTGLSIADDRRYLYYTCLLLCLTGLLGITITGDAFNIFVFLEITSLSSYALISLGEERRALSAAFSYLILGTIGGTFILIGIGLAYQLTGTLNLQDLAVRLAPVMGSRAALVSFAFFLVGLGIKLAVYPLHQWLPNAYTYAPSAVSAFLAATATKVSYYVLVRVIYTVFGAGFVFGVLHLERLLLPVSLAAMFLGSVAAIFQSDIKRLLAYSSVAQIGYMVLGLSMNSVTGLTGGLVHLFNHALMKGGLFLVVGCLSWRIGNHFIADLAGAGKRMPLTMAAFVVGGLSLIGVPGTVGFVSKWYLVLGALEQGWYPVAALVLISSLLAVVYVWRVIEIAYFGTPAEDMGGDAPVSMLVPTWVLIGATLLFGFWTDATAGVASQAARWMIGGGL